MKIYAGIGLLIILMSSGCGERVAETDLPVQHADVLRVLRPIRGVTGLPRGEDFELREVTLIKNFAKDHDLKLKWVKVSPAALTDRLAEGKGDLAISCRLEWIDAKAKVLFSRPVFNPLKPERGETTVDFEKNDPKTVWVVPQSSRKLLEKLNAFLVKEYPSVRPPSRMGDLAEMKERGYIRVLTRNNPASYFIHRGKLMGFEYELIKQYADQQGLDVVMIVPPRWADLKQWMVEGRGDVIAACITISDERKKSKELQFSHPYGTVQEIVVTDQSDTTLRSLKDLAGRTIHVRELSHYWTTLEKLKREGGIDFELKAVPGTMETREILHRVESGEFDLTMADTGFLDIEINSGRKLKSGLMFRTPYHYGWVVRKNNPELKSSIDTFLKKKVGTSSYTYLYGKYFRQSTFVQEFQDEGHGLKKAVISPYDDLIRASSEKYGFHWCLIAAVMYQESRFDPKAKSWSGARGLMQLMPLTAKELGLNEKMTLDPAKNIDAGVKYLGQQRKRVPDEVDAFNRLCFGLAAYNGGYGHLIDARDLAKKLGRNPNLWVDNVDYAYRLLSTPEYAKKSKYGYCRSEEITHYVRQIMARYISYKSDIERLEQAVK